MGCYMILYLALTASLLFELGTSSAGKFPLNGCHEEVMDVLLMDTLTDGPETIWWLYHSKMIENFANVWLKDTNKSSRALVSRVKQIFSHDKNRCNISLTSHDGQVTDICNILRESVSFNVSSTNLQMEIQANMKLASEVFSETDTDRENSTLVTILFVDLMRFPYATDDDIRRLPHALQNQSCNINFFIVLHNLGSEREVTHLQDLIVVGINIVGDRHTPIMALCGQCESGSFSLKRTNTGHLLSCYELKTSLTNISWHEASRVCGNNMKYLAAVESIAELEWLKVHLYSYILEYNRLFYNFTNFSDYHTTVYIGLQRSLHTIPQRFQWVLHNSSGHHPLVINHWLPGEPSGGFSSACGAWTFKDVSNISEMVTKSRDSEGWTSVRCGFKLTKLSLCEITIPCPLEDQDFIKVNPANRESFNRLSGKSEFREYEGNIISVSYYIRKESFRRYLESRNEEFPVFDCGDSAGEPRFISYSHVCDYIDHCSNKRDESMCTQLPCATCRSGQCTGPGTICDFYVDCEDGSDELFCDYCPGRRCCDGTCLPLHLFNDGEVDCIDCEGLHDESSFPEDYFERNETCAFTCYKNKCIYPSQMNNGITDCTGQEGPLDENIGKLERANSCFNAHGQLYWAPRCVYIVDRYGSVLGCRDLSHLQNCTDFQCQEGYYKCPGSYCIPQHYVLDGSSDCPVGEEENEIGVLPCEGNFACWDSRVCLHTDLVCDGHPDCPYKDDELNCDVSCAEGFRCIASTVTVRGYNKSIPLETINFIDVNTKYLDLSGTSLIKNTSLQTIVLANLRDVRLSSFKLTHLSHEYTTLYISIQGAYKLDMSNNLFTTFRGEDFQVGAFSNLRELNLSLNKELITFANLPLKYLEILDLSYTRLPYLEKGCFEGLLSLKHLNLSHTMLSIFPLDIFSGNFALNTLDLRGSPIVKFSEGMFEYLTIKGVLYTDNFGLCCPQIRGSGISADVCQAPEDPISSCFDLIGVEVQRILLWVVAVIALVGNLIVIVYRLIWDRDVLTKAHGLLMINFSVSDLIMGLHILIIVGADAYYRGVYILYNKEWKENAVCKIAGLLGILSNGTSKYFMFLVTLDRFLVTRFIYGQVRISKMSTIVSVVLAWGIGLLLALVIIIPLFISGSMFSYSSICLPLPHSNKIFNGWRYSFSVFTVLNFVTFIFTVAGQAAIFQAITAERISIETVNQNLLRRGQDIQLTRHLSLVVLSNFFCWFFVGLMGLLSMGGHRMTDDVYSWTMTFAVSINSAVNPLLDIIPMVKKKCEKFKFGISRE